MSRLHEFDGEMESVKEEAVKEGKVVRILCNSYTVYLFSYLQERIPNPNRLSSELYRYRILTSHPNLSAPIRRLHQRPLKKPKSRSRKILQIPPHSRSQRQRQHRQLLHFTLRCAAAGGARCWVRPLSLPHLLYHLAYFGGLFPRPWMVP